MARIFKDGWFHFSDEIAIDGRGASPFVIGRAWMIEFIDLASGSMTFISDGIDVEPNATKFAIYYSPFSIVSICIDDPKGKVEGFGRAEVSEDLPGAPALFTVPTSGTEDLELLFKAIRAGTAIPHNSRPSLISLRSKRAIDQHYSAEIAIADVAAGIGVSHEHLSRQFRKDFALSPLEYVHKLRMAEATFKLSQGAEIIEVSADIGYNDLGRFYKQFRKAFSTTPGSCK